MLDFDLRKSLGDLGIDAALTVERGVTVLFGPSGSGKTSILQMIAGLVRPDSGRIAVNGRPLFGEGTDLPPEARGVGYVFQEGRLFPHLNVRRNLMFGARSGQRFDEVAEMLALDPLLERRPRTLSGGEAQRVAMGRALLREPALILMDEPMASLDVGHKDQLLPYLRRFCAQAGLPVLYVTHSVDEAFRLGDRIALIEQGLIVAEGAPEDIFGGSGAAPRRGALLKGHVVGHHPADGLTEIDIAGTPVFVSSSALEAGASVRIRLNAADIAIALESPEGLSILNRLPARIDAIDIAETGRASLSLALQDGQRFGAGLTARSARELRLAPGREVLALFRTVAVTPDRLD
ncbi:MAG: molybdenum ABC transporter ATP-binding protein [Minwuia sp.]|uniref:molybdenum ABC transporter ATP-binding protein n=1 Tax=Minwuia sp. TaxID=2493630 RepID=UPI003A8B74DF